MNECSNSSEIKIDQKSDKKLPSCDFSDKISKKDKKNEKKKLKTAKETTVTAKKFKFFNKKCKTKENIEININNTSTSSQIELNLDSISSENVTMIHGQINQCEKLNDDDEIQKNKCSFILKANELIEKSVNTNEHNDSLGKNPKGFLLNKIQTNLIITYMYFLNYIPLGLFQSLILTLAEKNFQFSDLSIFSFVLWPYCFKFFYAPFVNGIYIKAFGQRKTWLCTCYFIIGIIFMSTAIFVRDIFRDIQQPIYLQNTNKLSNITKLTLVFTLISFVFSLSVSIFFVFELL
jgi:hypothetical protein